MSEEPRVGEQGIRRFAEDVAAFDGYAYTNRTRLSCRFANERMSVAIRKAVDLSGKRIIDVGCGDGTYTVELLDAGAKSVVGVDATQEAIACARARGAERPGVIFEAVDVYALEQSTERYDVVVLRGILHHLDDPARAIRTVCEIADEIIVVEPNGYNPLLKAIERVSPYHVAHQERSYSPRQLDRWFEAAGAQVIESTYVGLVPTFCPDLLARFLKKIEPFVERSRVLRRFCCAQYVQTVRASRSASRAVKIPLQK